MKRSLVTSKSCNSLTKISKYQTGCWLLSFWLSRSKTKPVISGFTRNTWIKSQDILVLYCIALSRWCLSHSGVWKSSRLLFIQQTTAYIESITIIFYLQKRSKGVLRWQSWVILENFVFSKAQPKAEGIQSKRKRPKQKKGVCNKRPIIRRIESELW